MRFKKIVFGLILSLMLAFPAYASEIIPISVDNAGVNSIIQPRGYVWSGTVPLPDAQYYYTMPGRRGTTTEVTISPKPGENIQLSWDYGKGGTHAQFQNTGGFQGYTTTQKTYSNTRSFTTYYTFTVPEGYTGGTINLFRPPWKNTNNAGDTVYYGDTHIIVHINSVHTHSWSWTGDGSNHWQVCSCGQTQNTAPHTWQEISNSASCTSPGTKTFKCPTCGKTKTETSQPLGHDKVFVRESEATCTEPAKKYYSCSRCHLTIIDEIGDPLGHDFQPKWYPVGQWQDVYWQDTCTRCGLVQGDRHYKEVPVNFITIDYHTKEELQRVTKLVTFDSIVRGDSLGTKNETFNGVEYRYHGATGLDNQLFARPDLDVYRYMVKHKYTIYFNPNGGEGEMTPITLTYGSRVTLPANTFTRTGYNFIGWSKTPTGSADYPDKYWSENDLRSQAEAGERCDLYAIWEGKTV